MFTVDNGEAYTGSVDKNNICDICGLAARDHYFGFCSAEEYNAANPKRIAPAPVPSIEQTLAQRDKRYGLFKTHARITQNIKMVMQDSLGWQKLTEDKKEALEMIAHKIGRILNGDPEYKDSWHDIVGYAKLVDDTLTE